MRTLAIMLVTFYSSTVDAEPSMTLLFDQMQWIDTSYAMPNEDSFLEVLPIHGCQLVFDTYLHRDHLDEEYQVCILVPSRNYEPVDDYVGDDRYPTKILLSHDTYWPCDDLGFSFVEPFSDEVFRRETIDGPRGTVFPAGNGYVTSAWFPHIDCSQIEAIYWFVDTPWWESDNVDYQGVLEGPFPPEIFMDTL